MFKGVIFVQMSEHVTKAGASSGTVAPIVCEHAGATGGEAPLLSVKDIYKSFGTNEVLKGISLDLMPGEVLALIGGNGAGKSTLMKIVMGIYHPDAGEVLIDNQPVDVSSPKVALEHSVYMVPQEPLLFPNMTVAENVTMGFQGRKSDLDRELRRVMDEIGWQLDLERTASTLSIAEQGMVEILRGLMRHSKVLILDEPTSALAFDEANSLFEVIDRLRRKGIGIIYITHRLAEVFQISTSVSILRDGIVTMQGPTGQFTRDDLVRGLLPLGFTAAREEGTREAAGAVDYDGEPALELRDFSGYGFRNVNLKVWPGEILGLAGVVGAGRTEMATTIFGRDKALGGDVLLDGRSIMGKRTRELIDLGINYVPEDRFRDALFCLRDVEENTTSSLLEAKSLGGLLVDRREAERVTGDYIKLFGIKVTDMYQEVGGLSGGNQQKIVIGRTFATAPKLVILDEPTRGIDAAARDDVYQVLQQLRSTGVAIMLISSDMEEIVELADRAAVMFRGRIDAEFSKDQISQDRLMAASFGISPEQAESEVQRSCAI